MSRSVQVTLAGQNWVFEARAGETILEAAEWSGVILPSSCRTGACRTCMCKSTRGKVRYHVEWPGLSKEEKRDGYILPCVAEAETDLTLEIPAARLQP
ncbi:2Fe-2S iron-sulfur cluster-binding protein [Duganella qianjiadongensis]|uniref:2Fe-2S iron-sulfur cluster binding domain-containing protein n=1 Tax=Duganella qianjiadongensis TaxID=2692176 RepID=A0ABW9VMM9_9BURK|nr:2Fe-2S iron-sulfur cluster binding domain-containing protein [Duganella qianjiadongensis]MYM40691.1 2Fe-2S iron-sulfur cluster binding domain-containing protein [Duganella qianjiadongensis]